MIVDSLTELKLSPLKVKYLKARKALGNNILKGKYTYGPGFIESINSSIGKLKMQFTELPWSPS